MEIFDVLSRLWRCRGYVAVTYTKLAGLRVRKNEAWSDISIQMKRRYDLIRNLVETAKGCASHKKIR